LINIKWHHLPKEHNTESSHMFSITGYYKSCIQSAQSMTSTAQTIANLGTSTQGINS